MPEIFLRPRVQQTLLLGEVEVKITVIEVRGGKVRLAIEAPAGTRVLRDELVERDERAAWRKPRQEID